MSPVRAELLNRSCDCESLPGTPAAFYSHSPVFLAGAHARQMEELIAAIHRVTALPAFQQAVLADAPAIAQRQPRSLGVFAGFDFHVTPEGPRLIEINTNAGGAMLNAAAEWRHPDCCGQGGRGMRAPAPRAQLETAFVAMFRNEWRLARGDRPLRTLAIIDDQPEKQFLYPEFRWFEDLFRSRGIDAIIADAAELALSDGCLVAKGRRIDLVYNRVTDFYFEQPAHRALREAYEQDAAVITPHPRAYAMFADKRNLARFTDEAFLRSVGVPEQDAEVLLAGIPPTRRVEGSTDDWWRDRKHWFFKPVSGFGSRGAYRGDKITRRAFGEVVQGGYMAQRLAPPGDRIRHDAHGARHFKVDIRCYVYDGVTQLRAARLYQGQTTNFRTAGGGFSPVIELLDV